MRRCRAVLLGIFLAGCGSPSAPSSPPPPPPPTPDPPKITCPASQSAQSTAGSATPVTFPSPTVVNGSPPVNTTCAPTSGSNFPVGTSQVACTATDALQRTDACTFGVTVLPPPVLKATFFLAFGDSQTWGEDGTAESFYPLALRPTVQLVGQTYPAVLQQELIARYTTQSPTVSNAGKPGESITDPTTFPRYVGYTSSGRYEVMLIMEGANDLGKRDANVFPKAIAGLRQMILDARSRNLRTLLATIPPENPAGPRGLGASLVAGFNDQVAGLAVSEGVPLVDVYKAFNGDLTLIGPDGLHPNAQGYKLIADTFLAAIEQNLETALTTTTGTAHIVTAAPLPAPAAARRRGR